jgi:hypothetical protein
MLPFQKFQIISGKKKLEQICRWSKDIVLQFLLFIKPNSKYTKINKKRQTAMWIELVSHFVFFVALFIFGLCFLFLVMHFEFDCKNSRNCKYISCEHLQFCSKFFCHLHFKILQMVWWYYFRYGITWYLPSAARLHVCLFGDVVRSRAAPGRQTPRTGTPKQHGLTVNVHVSTAGCCRRKRQHYPGQLLVCAPYVAKAFLGWCHYSCGLSEMLVISF